MRRDGGWREDSTKAEEMTEKRRRRSERQRRKRVREGAPKKLRRRAIVSPCQTCFETNELHYRKSGI